MISKVVSNSISCLPSIVSGDCSEPIDREGEHRQYGGIVSFVTKIQGIDEISCHNVVYRIGSTHSKKSNSNSALAFEQMYPTFRSHGPTVSCEINHRTIMDVTKRCLNMPIDIGFRAFNLAAYVERLAKTAAFYANHHVMTPEIMCAGQEVFVYSSRTDENSLNYFINSPACFLRNGNLNYGHNVVAAIAYALAAEDSSLISDFITIDTTTYKAVLIEVTGYHLMAGVYGALNLLGQVYAASGAGNVFSYAFYRGLRQLEF